LSDIFSKEEIPMLDSFYTLPPLVRDIANAVLIGVIGILVAYILSTLFSRLSKRTWGRYVGNLIALLVVFYTVKLILDAAHGVGVVVILGTALTGALALGSENFASDIVSGLKMLTIRPFKVGDIVSVAGNTLGEVDTITLTYTALIDGSGNRIIVRNSDVAVGKIINFSAFPVHRVEVQISIPASQDIEKAVAVILEGIKDFSPESADEKTRPGVNSTLVWNGIMKLIVYAYVAGEKNMDALDADKTRLLMTTVQALKQHNIALDPRQA
jgi:small-conductance mechanosensitive channel